jgi:hypothetical protein
VWTLGRNDTLVTFWAGQQEFRGMEPPRRLLMWRNLRRVYEERWRVMMAAQLCGSDALRPAFLALLAASPLSDLLYPVRQDPPLGLMRHAPLLRIPEVARAVAHTYLALGVPLVGAPLGHSLLGALVEHADHPGKPKRHEDLRTALGFVARLRLYTLLPLYISGRAPDPAEASAPHRAIYAGPTGPQGLGRWGEAGYASIEWALPVEGGRESPPLDDFESRRLCPDGACIGVLGDDGRCKVCGQLAP